MTSVRHLATNQHRVHRAPHARRAPGPEDARLDAIVGVWQVTGDIDGEETFERMAGDFFVHGRFWRMTSTGPHDGVIVLGFDRERGEIVSHQFDNHGYAREYVITIDDATWRWSGPYERATYRFDGDAYSATWEQSDDSRNWRPLCTLRGTRVAMC